MKPTLTRDGAIFKDGDIVTVTFIDWDDKNTLIFKDCKLAYIKASRYTKHWYILSDHRVLDGSYTRNTEECAQYKYSWSLGEKGFNSDSIEKIELQNVHKGKWANGSFRKKLIEKNII